MYKIELFLKKPAANIASGIHFRFEYLIIHTQWTKNKYEYK